MPRKQPLGMGGIVAETFYIFCFVVDRIVTQILNVGHMWIHCETGQVICHVCTGRCVVSADGMATWLGR